MAAKKQPNIAAIRHPMYLANSYDWQKWRLVYKGGECFVDEYLKKFSKRERPQDFKDRKCITPIPTFAKSAINDVKNSIFQRMVDISRQGGSEAYNEAVQGLEMGVDLCGSTMNSFIGQEILPELLTMGKVGCYVDMPPIDANASLADTYEARPYLYMYRIEDICSWTVRSSDKPDEYQALLLRDRCVREDETTYLASGEIERYRYVYIDPVTGFVNVQFYDNKGKPIDREGNPIDPASPPTQLNIKTIPFVCFDIKQSLLEDVANHQIALLNLGSSDVAYALKANFPFYVMENDSRPGSDYLKQANPDNTPDTGGQRASDKEVEVGPIQGIMFPKGATPPSFINPSAEPLTASMELQKKLATDIRLLINLSITNLDPTMASAESKGMDMTSLESGLSFIGLVLESGERTIARFWAMYENGPAASVTYPENYSLKSDADRRAEALDWANLMFKVPSRKYQQQIAKCIIGITQSAKVTAEDLQSMMDEVDNADYVTSDPDIINLDVMGGLVSAETASLARGYKAGEAEKAQKEKVQRATELMAAQTPPDQMGGGLTNPQARGVPDLTVDNGQSATEKAGKPQRGPGKKVDQA